jgi:hypothetical protein
MLILMQLRCHTIPTDSAIKLQHKVMIQIKRLGLLVVMHRGLP